MTWRQRATPAGPLAYALDADDRLAALQFGLAPHPVSADGTVFDAELDAYFAGELETFTHPLAPGGTAFQREVWAALRAIPYGTTTTYGALAAALGRPGASRAVGRANATNPIALVVPCHRVIGAGGALTGFAYGTEVKRWLLEHEGSARRLF